MNPQIQQQLESLNEELNMMVRDFTAVSYPMAKSEVRNRIKSFLTQALQETWNAAVKDTVEGIRIKPVICEHDSNAECLENECYIHQEGGYGEAVADQNELINKLDL